MTFIPITLETVHWDDLLHHRQSGKGPFIGLRRQRGGGLGAFLSTLVSMIPTFLNSSVGKELVNTGKDIVSDISSGSTIKDAAKARTRQS